MVAIGLRGSFSRSDTLDLQAQLDSAMELHRGGQLTEAALLFRSMLKTAPRHFRANHALGVICLQQGLLVEAEERLGVARAIDPNDPSAHYFHGNALLRLGRAGEALRSFDAALALRPDYFEAWHNRANTLRELDRLEDAIESYEKAVALRPDAPIALYNRALAFQDVGRLEDALSEYDRVVSMAPNLDDARKARGTLLLATGNLERGFSDFESRLARGDASLDPAIRAIPYWAGESLSGKSILVYGDGAFGDLVQFSRYLPMLAGLGGTVILLAPAQFHHVLSTDALRAHLTTEPEPADFRCELLSLPFLFKTGLETIPACANPFVRDDANVARWASAIDRKRFNIGICWQGNPTRNIDRGRSIPLAAFQQLAAVPNVQLISLQKHHGVEQISNLPEGMRVKTLGPEFDAGPDAFADTLAVMESLDLVVTSDTAMAHVAASAGRPTWIALRKIPEWRWMLDRGDSPWYPPARLFRQGRNGDWDAVFKDIAQSLACLIDAD